MARYSLVSNGIILFYRAKYMYNFILRKFTFLWARSNGYIPICIKRDATAGLSFVGH